ncbi:hypothetical protein [Bacillus atrophaeus]|uniref:hypothetical protein n=1 Tax=Bacillus atrophaeus TaxID=1452 RepID=UPI002E23FE8A|nr:hypothetical protein [Bacillus atrophaeus]
MIYLIVDKYNKKIIKTTDYETYQNTLESLGSDSNCSFFHIVSLIEEDFSKVLYAFTGSGEAPYKDFRLIEEN